MTRPADDTRARLIAEGRLRPATAGKTDYLADAERRLATTEVDHDNRGTAALLELREGERF